MRLPKSVIIAGRPWAVVEDKNLAGGSLDNNPGTITVGPHGSDDERMVFFLHEVLEAILVQRWRRYESYPEDYLFVMDHKELSNFVRDFYLAIKPLLMRGGKSTQEAKRG